MLPAWVLVGFRLISKEFGDLAGSLGVADPPVGMVPLAFVFTVICEGFKGGQSEIEVKSK